MVILFDLLQLWITTQILDSYITGTTELPVISTVTILVVFQYVIPQIFNNDTTEAPVNYNWDF